MTNLSVAEGRRNRKPSWEKQARPGEKGRPQGEEIPVRARNGPGGQRNLRPGEKPLSGQGNPGPRQGKPPDGGNPHPGRGPAPPP